MPIRPAPLVLAVVAGVLALLLGSAFAEDPSVMSCAQLWHGKNAILKAGGLCFTDPRAIRAFGNDGCTVDDPNRVPLTSEQRQRLARIVLSQKIKLCR